MAVSGVSRYARNEGELAEALRDATDDGPAREDMIAAGRALFAGDPADVVVELAEGTRAHALLTPFQTPKGRRRVALVAASLAGIYFMLTVGAHGVSAIGVGVAKAPKGHPDAVYVGVRTNLDELKDPGVVTAVERSGVTVVVDGQTARYASPELQDLVDAGVDIANGGWGEGRFLRWNRARDDCDKSWEVIAATSGEKTEEFVPGRALDAFDQLYCATGKNKQKLVRPNETFPPEIIPELEGRKVYLLDGRGRDPLAVALALEDFEARAEEAGLRIRPLGELR